MKKLLIALVLMLAVVFLISRFTEVTEIAEVLQKARWSILLVAVLFIALWMLASAAAYRAIYRELGLETTYPAMLLLFSSALFTNTVTPTAGISSIAVFLADAYQRGFSRAKVTIAWALFLLLEYIGLLIIVAMGIVVLFRRDQLDWAEISAALILLALAITLTVLLYLGARSASQLENALLRIVGWVNKLARPFIKRDYVERSSVGPFALEMADGISLVRHNLSALRLPILFSFLNKVCLLAAFTLTFVMFNVPFSAGTIIAGFAICYLFSVVTPTPAGVGIVEGVLPLSLAALHVNLSAATIITLAYRGLSFWLPLAIGLVSFRILTARQASPTGSGTSASD